jgi:phosphoribosyl 1,2-cyclic phosphodiesterase
MENNSVKLRVISSSSAGNAYAIDSGTEILLLEAGCKMADVKRAIDFRLQDVVGCCISHCHGDHAKYATEYAKFGVHIYCNEDVAQKKQFPYGSSSVVRLGKTVTIGSFRVCPIELHHDVPNYGYMVQHPDMGTLLFATDTYKMGLFIKGIDHWLIEANYDDRILKANVQDGKIDRAQANRLMLSHLSLDNTIQYLKMCEAEKSKTITLCHLSDRNSDPAIFRNTVAGAFGVPTFIAQKGLVVELNKDEI